MKRQVLCTFAFVGAFAVTGCSKSEDSTTGSGGESPPAPGAETKSDGARFTPGQLVRLLPAKVEGFSIFEPHGRFQDTPAVKSSMAKVLYVDATNRSISLQLTDFADGPEYLEAQQQGMADSGARQGLVSGEALDGTDVEGFIAEQKGGGAGRLEAVVGKRFHVRVGGNNGVTKAEVRTFWNASGIADSLRSAKPGPEELPAWAKAAREDAYPEPPTAAAAESKNEPTIEDVPDCGSLLTSADIKKACDATVELKPTGAADGKSQLCSAQGSGFIFLLSRLADAKTARRSAAVAAGTSGDGGIEDRKVYTKAWPTGGDVAVAPASNVLVELRSLPHRGKPPACTGEQVEALAKTVLSRLPKAK